MKSMKSVNSAVFFLIPVGTLQPFLTLPTETCYHKVSHIESPLIRNMQIALILHFNPLKKMSERQISLLIKAIRYGHGKKNTWKILSHNT
jgi:hypothetical protein